MGTIQIECRCGAVAVELTGDPLVHHYCHCDDCQAMHGAAYVPVVVYPAGAVRVTRGEPIAWALRTTPRTTCAACGTRLFAEPPGMSMRGVVAYLLPKGMFKPELHIFCEFAELPVKDDLPHYKTLPARYGGSDETVEW